MDAAIAMAILNPPVKPAFGQGRIVETISCSVKDLFAASVNPIPGSTLSGKITIPEYQRPYLWTDKELVQLVDDLEEYFKWDDPEKPCYYLGSIIIHKSQESLNVIDGQQRLTTVALLLAALGKSVPAIQYETPTSIRNIKKNYQKLLEPKLQSKIADIDPAVLNVTLIVTSCEDDAYTFFETQNTGGVRLTGVDIIKAHHLRAIPSKGDLQDLYAQQWEHQRSVSTVIELLLRARRWSVFGWKEVPSERDITRTKEAIIDEFSKKIRSSNQKKGYQLVQFSDNYRSISYAGSPLSIKQPLSSGENFIDYLKTFCELHNQLFIKRDDAIIDDRYYQFYEGVIEPVDGTSFLKDLFEVGMLCYASKFGVANITEAAFWIFRYSYSLRLSKSKAVFERSIPAFLKDGNYLLDIINHVHSHDEFLERMKEFKYNVNTDNLATGFVKSRFIKRVSKYFGFPSDFEPGKNYDEQLIIQIENKCNGK